MTRGKAWACAAMTIVAGVTSGGCSRRYRCAARGEVGALAAWHARGFVTDGPNVEVCEASAARFDAVFSSPPAWPAAWRALEDGLDARGFTDSPRRGYAARVGTSEAEATFERCTALAAGKLFECNEALRLRVAALPAEWRDAPFTVEADDSPALHHYTFGEWADGPIPALARAHNDAR